MTFPSSFEKLLEKIEPNLESNLKAGFRKTGIYPLEAQQAIERVPTRGTNDADETATAAAVDASLVDLLSELKHGPENQPCARRNRSKVNVSPGKSISAVDLEAGNPLPGNEQSANARSSKAQAGGTAKQQRRKRPRAAVIEESEDDSDESSGNSTDSSGSSGGAGDSSGDAGDSNNSIKVFGGS